jgi:hypothetical protein
MAKSLDFQPDHLNQTQTPTPPIVPPVAFWAGCKNLFNFLICKMGMGMEMVPSLWGL